LWAPAWVCNFQQDDCSSLALSLFRDCRYRSAFVFPLLLLTINTAVDSYSLFPSSSSSTRQLPADDDDRASHHDRSNKQTSHRFDLAGRFRRNPHRQAPHDRPHDAIPTGLLGWRPATTKQESPQQTDNRRHRRLARILGKEIELLAKPLQDLSFSSQVERGERKQSHHLHLSAPASQGWFIASLDRSGARPDYNQTGASQVRPGRANSLPPSPLRS
jgi:hypothetical protein